MLFTCLPHWYQSNVTTSLVTETASSNVLLFPSAILGAISLYCFLAQYLHINTVDRLQPSIDFSLPKFRNFIRYNSKNLFLLYSALAVFTAAFCASIFVWKCKSFINCLTDLRNFFAIFLILPIAAIIPYICYITKYQSVACFCDFLLAPSCIFCILCNLL